MNINEQQLFEAKQKLQQEITQYEQRLQELIQKQAKISKIEVLAQSILEYNNIQKQINDRAQIFSLLSAPPQSLRSPFVKSELFTYFEAAETVGPELVDLLVEDFIAQVQRDITQGDDNSIDLIQAEYKEYILPGKMMAERFDQLDDYIGEMNRFCRMQDPQYDDRRAEAVLIYAFERSIDADTRMEPTIQALRQMEFQYLTPQDRAQLLDHVEEHLAVLRYEATKNQNLAMDQAVKMMEQRQEESK